LANIEFGCLPTAIGGMPQTDPQAACAQILHYLRDIPAWPQLPNRAYNENMYVQFSQGLPGVVVENERIYVDRTQAHKDLEQFYADFLAGDYNKYPIGAEYAAGLHAFLSRENLSPWAVKGQVTGPVTLGMMVTDENRKSIIYDDVLGDTIPKLLKLKASWQEKVLGQISKRTIMFVDEPYMSAFGSVGMMLSEETVIGLINDVLSSINGVKGIHCCGNTDWAILLKTNTDIISFDTYNYADSLALYPAEVKKFLEKGGAIAWGVVPNNPETLAKETVASLKDRLEEAMAPFTRESVPFKQLVRQGLLTPSCQIASLETEEAAGQALELLAELSADIRKRYL
jgi:methionine synthase II (cobalamin-independent)